MLNVKKDNEIFNYSIVYYFVFSLNYVYNYYYWLKYVGFFAPLLFALLLR